MQKEQLLTGFVQGCGSQDPKAFRIQKGVEIVLVRAIRAHEQDAVLAVGPV
jgi:hypothetical protein